MRLEISLENDFREFIESLNEAGAEYLIVGGYAVALHGRPRYTKDLDVWVGQDPTNAARVIAALDLYGFGSLDLTGEDFSKPDYVVQLGYPPLRIDLITTIPGVDFNGAFHSRVIADVDGTPASFINADHLITNKRAAGRKQDLADAEQLSRRKRP